VTVFVVRLVIRDRYGASIGSTEDEITAKDPPRPRRRRSSSGRRFARRAGSSRWSPRSARRAPPQAPRSETLPRRGLVVSNDVVRRAVRDQTTRGRPG